MEDVLEAAHIIPYKYKGDDTNRCDNGLLLRADIHTRFDLGSLVGQSRNEGGSCERLAAYGVQKAALEGAASADRYPVATASQASGASRADRQRTAGGPALT